MPWLGMLAWGAFVAPLAYSQSLDSSGFGAETDPARWKVRRFDVRHGLPQSRVQTLTRDPDGWIWCGTLRGLARFDGQRFEKVPPPLPEISQEWTVTLAAAGPNQTLLLAYNYTHFFVRHEGRWEPLDGSDLMRQIDAPRFGAFLAPGIAVLENTIGTRHCVVQLERVSGPGLATGSKAQIRLKVLRFDSWSDHSKIQLVDHGKGLVHARDESGTWWKIGIEGRQQIPSAEAVAFETRWEKVEQNHPPGVRRSYLDSGIDGIWLGSDRSGLVHLAPPGVILYRHSGQPGEDSVNCLSPAADGSVIQSGKILSPKYSDYVMLHQNGRTWWSTNAGDAAEPVLALPGGTNWWAIRGKLFEVNRQGVVKIQKVDENDASYTTALSYGASGRIWWSRPNEVKETLDRSRWTPLQLPKVSGQRMASRWLSVLEVPDGSLWVGSIDYGACRVFPDRYERHTTTNGAPTDVLNPMLVDPDGTVWFASTEGLLRRRNGRWFAFDTRHGLTESMVLNVLDDLHGRLWVHGYQGIAGISREDLEAVASGKISRVRLYRPPDLLAWNIEGNGGTAPSAGRDGLGNLWFATASGTLCVPAEQLQTREVPAPVLRSVAVSSGVVWDDLKNPVAHQIALPPGAQTELVLRVMNPSRANAELAPMEHRLDPFDSDWQRTQDDGRALYRQLKPGTYYFRVRSAEGLGLDETSVQLDVSAIWYQTVAFKGAACAGFLLVALAGTHYSRRRKQEQEEARFRAQDEARRQQITRDLHDGIGAGLARISILANKSAPQLAESAQSLIRNLDELIWVTDPKRDNLERTIQYLLGIAESQLADLSINLRLEIPDELPQLHVAGPVRHQLVQWFRGALSNVIKHSGADRVVLRIQISAGRLVMEVVDNGRGFTAPTSKPERSGLKILEERIDSLGGEFFCDSVPGAGTHLLCRIPLDRLAPESSRSHDL